MTPIVFEGEADDGTRVRVFWDPADPESVTMFTLAPGSKATWSRPLELTRDGHPPRDVHPHGRVDR